MGIEYQGEPMGRPITIASPNRPHVADACAQAKCEYCGRYGPIGQCAGCGAMNRPVEVIDITNLSDAIPQYIERWRHA